MVQCTVSSQTSPATDVTWIMHVLAGNYIAGRSCDVRKTLLYTKVDNDLANGWIIVIGLMSSSTKLYNHIFLCSGCLPWIYPSHVLHNLENK